MVAALAMMSASGAGATDLNAGALMNEMELKQRYAYVSGVVEGLAYSRFLKDRPNEGGMVCISNWYYGGGAELWTDIEAWFGRHPDLPVGALVYAMVEKECGS